MLEIQGDEDGLLDEPLRLRVRGAGEQPVFWRARYRDDEGRVWRAAADRPEDLIAAWEPAKRVAGYVAALQSLRPVRIDVRAEVPDGRGAGRTVTRRLVAEGVRVRRWRDGPAATLYLPAGADRVTVLVDATASRELAAVAVPAAALLASHGARALVVGHGRGKDAGAAAVAAARERLAAMLGVDDAALIVLPALSPGEPGEGVVLPPGVGVCGEPEPAARIAAWVALRARLGLA